MSPAENRRARDAVRRTTRASTARPGHIEYVRTPLPPSLKLRRTSRGVPRSPRIEGHYVNLRAQAPRSFRRRLFARNPTFCALTPGKN